MTYRLAFERAKETAGTPWAVELPSGERLYFRQVLLDVPCRTVLVPDDPRYHGYLEATGELRIDGDVARIGEQRHAD